MKKGENNVPVQIQKSPENITIVNSDNLFVNITLDDLIEKTVPLNVYTVGNPKEGYYSTKPSANITDVTVKGAGRFINQIHKAQVKCDISNMYRDLNITLPVQAVDVNGNIIKDVKVHPISTEVRVPIKKAKTVSINVKTTGKLNDNRVLDKITALPEKVDITGEENIINNINSLDTEVINLENVKGEEITSKLIVPKGVTLVNNNGYVKIKIASNYIINKEIPLTVKTINEDKNYSISLDKEQVTLTVSALQEEINNLKPEDIECYIDLKDLKEGQHSLQVKISLPESIKIISISPENITVNIKKKIIVEDENANKDK
nr:CdaR family protein [Clostridium tetanomorphum]